jgi:hypothetical protein
MSRKSRPAELRWLRCSSSSSVNGVAKGPWPPASVSAGVFNVQAGPGCVLGLMLAISLGANAMSTCALKRTASSMPTLVPTGARSGAARSSRLMA